MSPPPSIRAITREALKDAPAWVDSLLQPLNTFMRQVADGLTSNITPSENLAQSWVVLNVTEGVAVPAFVVSLKGRLPMGVTVEKVGTLGTGSTPGVQPSSSVGILWEPTTVDDKPGIRISNVFGLAPGGRYTLTLLVKAE